MARKSRKNGSGFGLASRLMSPFVNVGKSVGNSVNRVSRGVGKVAKTVVNTATGVGSNLARGTNRAINSPGHTKHDTGEAVGIHIIAQPNHHRVPGVGQRRL